MNRVSINRRFALWAGAVAVAGLVVVGGAAAANAAATPAPPALVAVDGSPDMSKVQPGELSPAAPHPAVVVGDGTAVTLTEVPGAVPDISQVEIVEPTEADGVPVVVGDGGTTAKDKTTARN